MNGKTTLMNAEVYEALISASVPEEKAKAAAESVVAPGDFHEMRDSLVSMDRRLAVVEADMRWVKWFQGATTAMVMVAGVKYLFA